MLKKILIIACSIILLFASACTQDAYLLKNLQDAKIIFSQNDRLWIDLNNDDQPQEEEFVIDLNNDGSITLTDTLELIIAQSQDPSFVTEVADLLMADTMRDPLTSQSLQADFIPRLEKTSETLTDGLLLDRLQSATLIFKTESRYWVDLNNDNQSQPEEFALDAANNGSVSLTDVLELIITGSHDPAYLSKVIELVNAGSSTAPVLYQKLQSNLIPRLEEARQVLDDQSCYKNYKNQKALIQQYDELGFQLLETGYQVAPAHWIYLPGHLKIAATDVETSFYTYDDERSAWSSHIKLKKDTPGFQLPGTTQKVMLKTGSSISYFENGLISYLSLENDLPGFQLPGTIEGVDLKAGTSISYFENGQIEKIGWEKEISGLQLPGIDEKATVDANHWINFNKNGTIEGITLAKDLHGINLPGALGRVNLKAGGWLYFYNSGEIASIAGIESLPNMQLPGMTEKMSFKRSPNIGFYKNGKISGVRTTWDELKVQIPCITGEVNLKAPADVDYYENGNISRLYPHRDISGVKVPGTPQYRLLPKAKTFSTFSQVEESVG